MFSAAFENTGGTGWDGSKIPYSDVSCTMDTAFQDLRFFTRIITSDEIAGYAALYPAAGSAVMDIGDYSFRHDFSSGALAVDGDGYSDDSNSPMSGKGTRVLGAKNGSKYATFPDSTGFGMIKSGLNCDWTCAMSVKPGSVNADYGVLLGLGGIRDAGKRVMTICSTPNAGELFVSIPQKYGSDNGQSNITSNKGTISGLGNTKDEFHTLVIVHAHGQRTHKSTIDGKAYTGDVGNPNASGVFTFYWDGEFAGTLATGDGATRPFMDMIQYGAIYNEKPAQGGDKYHTLTDVSCGTAFQDLRFIPKAWGTAEADAYAKEFPVSRQARPGFRLVLQ